MRCKKVLSWDNRQNLECRVRNLLESIFGSLNINKVDDYRLYILDLGYDKFIRILPMRKSNTIEIVVSEDIPYKKVIKLIALLKVSGINHIDKKIKYVDITPAYYT